MVKLNELNLFQKRFELNISTNLLPDQWQSAVSDTVYQSQFSVHKSYRTHCVFLGFSSSSVGGGGLVSNKGGWG